MFYPLYVNTVMLYWMLFEWIWEYAACTVLHVNAFYYKKCLKFLFFCYVMSTLLILIALIRKFQTLEN